MGLSASLTLLLSPSISCLSLFFFDLSWPPTDEGEAQACKDINNNKSFNPLLQLFPKTTTLGPAQKLKKLHRGSRG